MSERDFVTALSRGLAVIRAFNRDRPEMTLTEVAAYTGLSPATARRSLYTLQALGYISSHGRRFMLRSKVLDLGSAFWSSMKIEEVAQAHLREIVDSVGDSSSLAVLEGHDVLYLAHAASRRTIRMAAEIGARFPAYATSIGRAMLAHLDPPVLERYLDSVVMKPLTERTVTDPTRLKQILTDVRKNGYACTQDELDYGLASVAVPVMIGDRAVAAINSSANSARIGKDELARARVSILQRTSIAIARALEQSPALLHSLSSNQTEKYLWPPPAPEFTEGRITR
ncbi:MAG TPA: IclR family transcriptional regulator C-terminal domain-containing protein [Stellaceae bacterium]